MRTASLEVGDVEAAPTMHAPRSSRNARSRPWSTVCDGQRRAAEPDDRFHWLAWGITPDAGGLVDGEAAPLEGRNDFRTLDYRGPCPPRWSGPSGARSSRSRNSSGPTNADPGGPRPSHSGNLVEGTVRERGHLAAGRPVQGCCRPRSRSVAVTSARQRLPPGSGRSAWRLPRRAGRPSVPR